MADLSDVLDAVAATIATSLYPAGTVDSAGNAILSSVGLAVKVMRGSPFAMQLDDDLRAGVVNITVNERPGVGRTTTRFQTDWQVQSISSPTVTSAVAADTLTIGGAVTPGQGILIVVDGQPYAYRFQSGDSLSTIASQLVQLIMVDRPALSSGATVTIPGAFQITARAVVPGVAVRPTRQQSAGISVKVFAPSFAVRDLVASAVDANLATISRMTLADGSVAMFRYSGAAYDDQSQKALSFIRTLLYQAEYSTVQTDNETTIGVMEAVLSPGARGGVPGPITLVTDVGPPIGLLPSDVSVLIANSEISVDSYGNPEIAL